ncbi:hypothetical protein COS78_00485 [Candidatus Shapirobacteria bacterium CG06_land_8_20_14_3_00_40_12]|uniref:Uncharacterized protein n=2 Tax=Candidatus Shapironibacteriota TaxID=1752721 RepID=A0A2M7TUG5_9BACT|nr:MAG: hypothetical protein COS78_00485 [Candidatus Shapirobacteria bacterium CG06_land_8_20_14_3_00_40_12]PIZ60520.1 MAG: hypothetical protein COY20_01170 [Candidatus Shapirobacteria bacterium CG_4_10_14_0_2_um_filter_40_12]
MSQYDNEKPIETPNFEEVYYRCFKVNEKQLTIIRREVNEWAPPAIRRPISPSPRFPLGGTLRVIVPLSTSEKAVIEVKKITGYSPDWERNSIH